MHSISVLKHLGELIGKDRDKLEKCKNYSIIKSTPGRERLDFYNDVLCEVSAVVLCYALYKTQFFNASSRLPITSFA